MKPIVKLYLMPHKRSASVPASTGTCVAFDKQCATSTEISYTPAESAVKEYLDALDRQEKIELVIFDLTDARVAIRARLRGISGPSVVIGPRRADHYRYFGNRHPAHV